jgi:hypothetical protein
MLYALLAYHDEGEVIAMSEADDIAKMDRMNQVHARLTTVGQLGPAARLGATMLAKTVRKRGVVLDGPFAETKEHLLGFYILDCADEAEALAAVDALKAVNPEAVYELRPIVLYLPGTDIPMTDAGLEAVRPGA